ncbi:MAG: hypothetical protein CMQ43_02640 [Gammaproteobacteria bacterium]|nr:hypothetical protein [Gammaproteobacteria bacterium]|tara:strand:+ start:350 stop:964 length:615 start_codon:yes stop_codon:yes gene_type:complete
MNWTFDLCGDHLALDFANTVSDRDSAQPVERLPDYRALLGFALQMGLVSDARADALGRAASRDPGAAGRALARAVRLRDGLFELFAAIARGARPSDAALAAINGEMAGLRISDDLELSWATSDDDAGGFLGAVVVAAVRLATDAQARRRVRLCEAPDCVWLFYDSTRNRSRRWCDMRQCGNRMKARRHQARRRGGAQGGSGQKV